MCKIGPFFDHPSPSVLTSYVYVPQLKVNKYSENALNCAPSQNAAHMADGYARVTGKTGVCVAQNGPGITNFVTGVAAAFWANSPMVVVTPEAGTNTAGLGGFQETQQLPIFETITKEQVSFQRFNYHISCNVL